MPLFSYQCTCGNNFEKFSFKMDKPSVVPCPKCGVNANLHFSEVQFIPPEGDLTFISNRIRLRDGLYHDQDYKARKKAEELNKDMADANKSMMGRGGYTEQVDEYARED